MKRAGLIEFQDAMIGPTAYALASIVQDARVDSPAPRAEAILDTSVSQTAAAVQ